MVTVFYGEDTYRSREAFTRARVTAEKQHRTAVQTLRDEQLTPTSFQTAAGGQTLFGDRPLLAVERLTVFTGAPATAVADILRQIPAERSVCIWEEGVPAKNGIVWCALEACAGSLERFDPLGEPAVRSWMRDRVRQEGREIEPAAGERLVSLCGSNLWLLAATLESALLATANHRLTDADVAPYAPLPPAARVFDIVHAFVRQDTRQALRAFTAFRAAGEEPRSVLFWVIRDLQHLLRLREYLDQGERLTSWDVARQFRLPNTAAEHLLEAAQHTSLPVLQALFDRCAVAYYHLNTGRAQADEILESLALANLGDRRVSVQSSATA